MSEHDALFLGVDGGGTSTRAVLVDTSGEVRGRGAASSANQEVIGRDAAVAAVHAAVHAALAEAGAELPVRAAWVGLAGVDSPADAEALRPALAPLADHLRVSNDAELLVGALPGGVGVALIAGTGSIALGRNAAGETTRAGGWGHIFGDEGSGYALGVAALRAAARAADGRGEPTALRLAVLRTLDVAAPYALIARVHQDCDKAAIARLASLVVAEAEADDAVARTILHQAAADLAEQAHAVMRTLALEAPVALALGGGLLLEAPAYRAVVLEALGGELTFAPAKLVRDAALAAARAARSLVE
ncbi:MAG TPA: BadF/BadG/BcrA/BcrD ATPase family protein [Ktedonobacterales bacterium]